jgi:hypothetical protein
MTHPRAGGWARRMALLSMSFSSMFARKRLHELQRSLNVDQWADLLERADENSKKIDLTTVPDDQFRSLISPEALLCHPMLVHYIRPAARMALANGYEISDLPVITNPLLTFGGHALKLDRAGLKIAEIPLGLVFILREIGRGILNLHNAIQGSRNINTLLFAAACSELSSLIYEPPAFSFLLGETVFSKTSFAHKLYASQFTHILGTFIILHEVGHICKNHNLDPRSEEQSARQEHEADLFAMECLFATKKGKEMYEPFRKLMVIAVCDLLTLMGIDFERSGASLNGYPPFEARRQLILDHFGSANSVKDAVSRFEQEVKKAPRMPGPIPQS